MTENDIMPHAKSSAKGLYMSAVVAMCGKNFAIMASDSRMVELCDGEVVRVVNDNVEKIVRVNDHVMLGIAGDYGAYEHILVPIKSNGYSLDLPQVAQEAYNRARSFKLGTLPLTVFVAGKGRDGEFVIAELASANGYYPDLYLPGDTNERYIRLAAPFIKDKEVLRLVNERLDKAAASGSLAEAKDRLSNLIKNIANRDCSVNKVVRCKIVT